MLSPDVTFLSIPYVQHCVQVILCGYGLLVRCQSHISILFELVLYVCSTVSRMPDDCFPNKLFCGQQLLWQVVKVVPKSKGNVYEVGLGEDSKM